jgi:hypothetical protein
VQGAISAHCTPARPMSRRAQALASPKLATVSRVMMPRVREFGGAGLSAVHHRTRLWAPARAVVGAQSHTADVPAAMPEGACKEVAVPREAPVWLY